MTILPCGCAVRSNGEPIGLCATGANLLREAENYSMYGLQSVHGAEAWRAYRLHLRPESKEKVA